MKRTSFNVVTQDLPAMVAFYEIITGCPSVGTNDYIEIATRNSVLALCTPRAVAAPGGGETTVVNNYSTILEFEVADVDAARSLLAGRVTEWVLEPTDHPSGCRSMLFRDPDGNLVNLFTLPATQPRGPQNLTWL